MKSLFTTGHEGRTVDELLARLKADRLGHVVDARALPRSHKRGFSTSALEHIGISYAHRRALDTPNAMRARHKRRYDFRALKAAFAKYLEDQAPSLLELVERVRRWPACVFCFEADPALCHRSPVATAGQRLGGPPAKYP